jgi:hypothetical protein
MQACLAGGDSDCENCRRVNAYVVMAMTHYRQNQFEDARAHLAKGTELMQARLPKLESGDLGDCWEDWVVANALIHEATALMDGK